MTGLKAFGHYSGLSLIQVKLFRWTERQVSHFGSLSSQKFFDTAIQVVICYIHISNKNAQTSFGLFVFVFTWMKCKIPYVKFLYSLKIEIFVIAY